MSAELKAQVESLKAEVAEHRKDIEALKRFQVAATTLWAATIGLIGFFAEKIKKVFGI